MSNADEELMRLATQDITEDAIALLEYRLAALERLVAAGNKS